MYRTFFVTLIQRAAHSQRDSPGGSTRLGRPAYTVYYDDGQACFNTNYNDLNACSAASRVVHTSGWRAPCLVCWSRSEARLTVRYTLRLHARRPCVSPGTRERQETDHTRSCRDSRRPTWPAARRVLRGSSCRQRSWRRISTSATAGCNTPTSVLCKARTILYQPGILLGAVA